MTLRQPSTTAVPDCRNLEAVRIVLLRHGETEWSRTRRHTGRTDLPLTDVGEAEARAVAGALGQRRFGQVLSSPLQRAADTARLAGLHPELVDDLREWDYGDYEGRTTADIRRDHPGWTIWDGPVPGGESSADVTARVDRVVARLREADGNVVIFSHGHLLRALTARWLGLPVGAGRSFVLETGTLSELGYERETPVIWRWNAPPAPSPPTPPE